MIGNLHMNENLWLACEICQVGVERQAAPYGLALNVRKVENELESSETSDNLISYHHNIITHHNMMKTSYRLSLITQIFWFQALQLEFSKFLGVLKRLQGRSPLCLRCAEGGADAADAQSSVANRDSCRARPAAVRHIGEAATGGSACCHWPDARALDADILMERSTKKAGIRSSWKSWDCHMSQMSQFTIF